MTILLLVLGFVVFGLVVALLLVLLFGTAADRIAGSPALRQSLVARGVDKRLVHMMDLEWAGASARPAGVLLLICVSLGALLAARLLRVPIALTPETLAFAIPSACGLLWAGWLLRNIRTRADDSPLHHRLVTRGSEVVEVAPTTLMLNINLTTALDALFATRVTQLQPIPHVVVRSRDGSPLVMRAFHDQDAGARETLAVLTRMLPHVRVGAFETAPPAIPLPPPPRGFMRAAATLAGIAALTVAAVAGASAAEDRQLEDAHKASERSVTDAVAIALKTKVAAAPWSCDVELDHTSLVAFATRGEEGLERPGIMDRDAPFALSSYGASTVDQLPHYVVFARIRASASRITLAAVLVDVRDRRAVCTGELSGPVKAYVPHDSVRTIENLLARSVCAPSSKDPLCVRSAK